jgi:hypothetical protein
MMDKVINHEHSDLSSLDLDSKNVALGNTLGPDEFSKQRTSIRSYFFKNNPETTFWYNAPPSRDYTGRKRYRLSEKEMIFKNLAIDWRTGFNLTYKLLPVEFRQDWLSEMYYFGIHLITDERFIRDYLGKISVLYFSSGRHISYWKFFVGLELLGDFHVATDDIIESSIGKRFLYGDTYLDKTTLSRKKRYTLFRKHVRTAVHNIRTVKVKESVKEFFVNRKMDLGRSGATTYLFDKEYTKNKRNTAVNINYKEYKQMISEYDHNTSKVFIKRENKKPRLVVNGDTRYNIICELVWRFIQEKNDNGIYTYMKSADQKYLDYLDDMTNLRKGRTGFPIDQSSFDHQIELEMMLEIADNIILTCKANHLIKDDDMDEAFKLFREGIINHWVERPNGEKIKTVKGLPSGSRWTILMDTLISHILNEMALEIAKVKLSKKAFTGDDVNAFVFSEEDARALANAYTTIGVLFHPSKSYISVLYSEYLRVIVKHYALEGYPLRSIHSVTISNPAKEVRGRQDIEIQTICESWLNLYYRGFDLKAVLQHMVQDLKNSVLAKYDKRTIINFLSTDKTKGGLGMSMLFKNSGAKIDQEVILETQRDLYFKNYKAKEKYYERRQKLSKKIDSLELDKGVLDSLLKTKYRYTFKLKVLNKEDLWNNVGRNTRYKDTIYEKATSILEEMSVYGHNNPKFYKERNRIKKAIRYKFKGGTLHSKLYNSNLVNEVYANISNTDKIEEIRIKYDAEYIDTNYIKSKRTKRAFEDFQSMGFKYRYHLNYHPNFISSFYKEHYRFYLNTFSRRFKGRITNGVLDNIASIYHDNVHNLVSNFIAGRVEL